VPKLSQFQIKQKPVAALMLCVVGALYLKKEYSHYCLTDLSVDSNDITALVSGEQKHYFHLWGLQKPLVAFATRDFFRPHS
jgi:hypothetical protein